MFNSSVEEGNLITSGTWNLHCITVLPFSRSVINMVSWQPPGHLSQIESYIFLSRLRSSPFVSPKSWSLSACPTGLVKSSLHGNVHQEKVVTLFGFRSLQIDRVSNVTWRLSVARWPAYGRFRHCRGSLLIPMLSNFSKSFSTISSSLALTCLV